MSAQLDAVVVRRAWNLLTQPGEVHEVRLPATRKGVISGYFNDPEAMIRELEAHADGYRDGIYVTLNPTNPVLLARANNRLTFYSKTTTADKEIVELRKLVLDFDVQRPAGISSTDEEHQLALDRGIQAREELLAEGWPLGHLCDSGNGCHLVYNIALQNDDAGRKLLKAALDSLAKRFSTEAVKMDTTMSNPARISKVYGTWARKGDSVPDRPHRLATILELGSMELVTSEQLQAFAPAEAQAKNKPEWKPGRTFTPESDSEQWLEQWLLEHHVPVRRREPWHGGGGTRWILECCPFNPDHNNGTCAAILCHGDGTLGFNCGHNSCGSYTWHDVRRHFEPDWQPYQTGSNGRRANAKGTPATALEILDEEEPQTEVDAIPLFPRLPGPVGCLVDGITPDLAYDHKALCALTYLGVEITGRFGMEPDHWLQPRFYSCTVGPAAAGKSAPDKEVRQALQRHGVLTCRVEISIDSGPALVEALQESNRLVLAPDELAEQFEKCRAGVAGRNSLFGEFLRLYESNETGNHTKMKRGGKDGGGRIEINNAMFAMIASATEERFGRMWLGTGAVASGLRSRFTVSYGAQVPPRIKTPNDEAKIQYACLELKQAIRERPWSESQPDGHRLCILHFSDAAAQAILAWRPGDTLADERFKRVLDTAKRVALVMAVTLGRDEIDETAMRVGLDFADYQVALRDKLFPLGDAASYVQEFENRIINFLEMHAPASDAVIQNWIKPEKLLGGYDAYNRAFASLLRAGRVAVVGKSRKKGLAMYGPRAWNECRN